LKNMRFGMRLLPVGAFCRMGSLRPVATEVAPTKALARMWVSL
jgi:hypothetical protein